MNFLKRQFYSRYLLTIAWMGLIFTLSSISTLPGPEQITWDFFFKKGAHMFVYAVLFRLVLRSIRYDKSPQFKDYLASFFIVFLYALSDEWHQSFTPGRSPRLYDIGYDMWGAWVAFISIQLNVDAFFQSFFASNRYTIKLKPNK